MQKALFSLLAGTVVGIPATAQITIDPCGPALVNEQPNTELNNLALGVQAVAQVQLIPDPTGQATYMGMATVQRTGATDYSPMSFSWTPGSNAVANTDADALDGPADEFQCSLTRDGLVTVLDTGGGHPVGNGNPIVAVRAMPSGPFTTVAAITGVPGGYIDPQLGKLNGQDVIFYVPPAGGIGVADIDIDPNSATFATASNPRTAVAPQTQLPGYQFEHSPTTQYDETTNESVGIFFSIFASGTGSDPYFQSTADRTPFAGANGLGTLIPYAVFDDGNDWNANPAVIAGTAYYADAAGGYGDPHQYDTVTLSSGATSATNGGTIRMVGSMPNGAAAGNTILSVVNVGAFDLPNPIDPDTLPGITGYGNLCVASVVDANTGPVMPNDQFSLTLNIAAGTPAAVLYAQAICADINTNEVFVSNKAILETN